MKNNILFINLARGFGGGEVQTERLILALSHYHCVFFGKKNGVLGKRLAEHNITVLPNFWAVCCFLWRQPKTLIHACDGRSVHLAAFLKLCFRLPLLITRHVVFPLKRKSSQISYRLADAVVGVSKVASENIQAINPNVQTIYGAVDKLPESHDIAADFVANQAALRVAQIGNFQAVKNFALTIQLAKRLPEIHFYLVGSGELEQDLKQQAEGLANVHFIPFTPYLGSVMQNIDVQLLPSLSEGLPTVIIEAYQYGVPVLANKVGGVPEIVLDGKTGFLVENNELEIYQQHLQHFLHAPDDLQLLKQNVQQFWQEHDFSAKRMADEYAKLYATLLS